jgi:hypothetical protein
MKDVSGFSQLRYLKALQCLQAQLVHWSLMKDVSEFSRLTDVQETGTYVFGGCAGKLTALDKKWVEVVFEPPQVELGALKMQYGGNSSVKLAVLYLDEVVRIGRGSRGSLFIFKRRT